MYSAYFLCSTLSYATKWHAYINFKIRNIITYTYTLKLIFLLKRITGFASITLIFIRYIYAKNLQLIYFRAINSNAQKVVIFAKGFRTDISGTLTNFFFLKTTD